MATMYSLFLGFLLAAVCRGNGDSVVSSLKPRVAHTFLLDQESMQRNQGLVAHPKFNLCSLKIKNSPDLSGSNSLIFLTRSPFKFLTVSQPRPVYSATACTPLQSGLISSVKQFFYDDLLAYGIKGRKATNGSSVYFALDQDFQSMGWTGEQETSETASVALRSRDEHRVNSLDLCGTFYQGKVPRQSANEDNKKIKDDRPIRLHFVSLKVTGGLRDRILKIASKELGIKESTGNNDGPRVEQYLRYTNLGPGYEWCAAFVSWVYGQAGLAQPRNPWSPALFPKARSYKASAKIQQADLFAIYSTKAKRIHHVGLIKEKQGQYILTIEGNSNDRVESRRRHLKTVYSYADWVSKN